MQIKRFLIPVGTAAVMVLASLVIPQQAAAQQGGPKVTIGGPLPLPVTNVDEPLRTPYQVDIDCTGAFGGCPANYSVPTGKRLVIQHISARVRVAQGSQPEVVLFSGFETAGNIAVQVELKTEALSEGGGNATSIVSQPVVAYAEGAINNKLQLSSWSGGTLSPAGNVALSGTITGYLIDVAE
jgi:hypothetical protein